jgi:hypothetical protein
MPRHEELMVTRTFPTEKVLSVLTGRLLCDIDGVYEVLGWMAGEALFTHQLPRIAREARPVMIKLHPQLAQAQEEAKLVTTENWRSWREEWIDRYGTEIVLRKMTACEHEHIEPISEAVEMIPPGKIFPLCVSDIP